MESFVITRQKNDCYFIPTKGCIAGDGAVLHVEIEAPGTIQNVVMSKTIGGPCDWTHPCDGRFCPAPYQEEYLTQSGNHWSWYGWSNSGDDCTLTFTVSYFPSPLPADRVGGHLLPNFA